MADITSKVIFGVDTAEFRRGMQKVDSQLKQTANQFKNIGGMIGAAFAVSQITAFGKEVVALGSQMQTVRAAFSQLSQAGDIEKLRQATRGMVSDLDLMKMANQARSVGIEMTTLTKVMEYTSRYAKATGQDMNMLISDATAELVKQTGQRLDQLGISITDVRARMRDGGDFVNSVLAEMNENMGKLGAETETVSDKIAKLETSWNNMKTAIGESIAGPLAWAIDWAMELTGYFTTLLTLLDSLRGGARFANQAIGVGGGAKPAAAATTAQPATATVQDPVRSISLLRENLKALEQEFENVAIGSARFNELKKEIEEANYELGRATGDIWPGAKEKLIELDKGALIPFNNNLRITGEVLRQSVIPAMESTIGTVEQIQESLDRYNTQMQFLTAVGAEFGYVFSGAFNAAMANGTSFFEEIAKSIKAYVQQMIIALGVTTALALVFSSITKGLTFGQAFGAVAKGTGLGGIFGEGGVIELFTKIRGFDIEANSQRVNGVLNMVR